MEYHKHTKEKMSVTTFHFIRNATFKALTIILKSRKQNKVNSNLFPNLRICKNTFSRIFALLPSVEVTRA